MKSFLNKNKTLFLILWVSLLSASVAFASSILASEVLYTPTDSSWSVTNVQQATDSLYLNITRKNPVGEIIAYMGTIVPEYFLECNGTVYGIADYPYLAEQIKNNFGSYNKFGGNGTTTFAVPDLRGEFLRGAGTNSHANQGNGSTVGTHQDGTVHNFYYNNTGSVYGGGINGSTITTADKTQNSWANSWHPSSGGQASGANGGRGTSRPTNTSVMYAIRYE